MRISRFAAPFVVPTFLASTLFAQVPASQTSVQQFQHLEDDWSLALANKDQFALENLLAPSFLNISASAAISTRNQLISDALGSVPEPLVSIEQRVVNVRVVSDVAVVEGTYMLRLREDGRTRDERGVFTHVYQRMRNNWSCVSAQRTAVVDQLEAGKGKSPAASSEKKSSAVLPFHIPLLYKGQDAKTPPAASVANNPPQ